VLIAKLRAQFHQSHEVRGVLAILGDQPIEQKRAEVYPAVIALLVESLCGAPPKAPRSVVSTLHFLHAKRSRRF
jgi:hypothetical protein